MSISRLVCENYKCFKERQDIEIRPLTLLVGANSSGKSVIARLPALIVNAFSMATNSPLEWYFDEMDYGAAFSDLIYRNASHGSIQLGVEFADRPIVSDHPGFETKRLDVTLQNVQEELQLSYPIISEYMLRFGDHQVVRAKWNEATPNREQNTYHVECDNFDKEIDTPFYGFQWPTKTCDKLPSEIDKQLSAFQAVCGSTLLSEVSYLGPFRSEPERYYRSSGMRAQHLGKAGANTASLFAERTDQAKRLLDEVGDWFRLHCGQTLDVVSEGRFHSLVLRSDKSDSFSVNLVDVGVGISQVLPVVAQCKLRRSQESTPSLDVYEQPELHLHPQVHGALADLFIESVKETQSRVIVETHSEVLLLRLRRRVAEGLLDPKDVIIYWVTKRDEGGSTVVPIEIRGNGEVDQWPTDVFSDAYNEVKAIRAAARRQQNESDDK